MKRILLVAVIIFSLLVPFAFADEQLNLSPARVCATFRLTALYFDWDGKLINITVKCTETGEIKIFSYTGDVARDLMVTLNKVNLSTISLKTRVFNKLIADGYLTGTVSGSPD